MKQENIWLVNIEFKDTEGENRGRNESFCLKESDFWSLWDTIRAKYNAVAHNISNPYINTKDEIVETYLK